MTSHDILNLALIVVLVGLASWLILRGYRWALQLFGVVIVPDDSLGIVTKKFVLFGPNRRLPDGQIVALRGEAGYQADTLAPGLHWGLWPWQFAVTMKQFTVIPQGQVGVVQACDGKPLPSGRIFAKPVECGNFQDARAFLGSGGERGPQLAVIPPGKYRINDLLFTVEIKPMISVPANQIGVVEALDGKPLESGRILAPRVECDAFQDGAAFLSSGGQRGPQMAIITPGTYRVNPTLFRVTMSPVVEVPQNKIGIVTSMEGQALPTGSIAGPEVEGHRMFQDPDTFVTKGGFKGLQEQVLLAGRYFINPRFATVELVDLYEVPIAHVGVVIAYVGNEGVDVTGESFRHGNLVRRGQKDVWIDPLDPGKYPINPYTHKVSNVPTANVVLNWATGKTEAHMLDANLSTITVRSADGFRFNLDVSQVIHVPRSDAPKVIARFGSMQALVTQVLEPTIGNYFRNAAQGSDIIEFLKHRAERQIEARKAICDALSEYNVGAIDTLIGDIVPPDELMKTLTDRKIAEQERITYETQEQAQQQRQKLAQATAMADTQPSVVSAERQVAIAEFNAQAAVKQAQGQASSKTINADADATVTRVTGEALAGKTRAIGEAEADVIKAKIASMDPSNYAAVAIAQAFAEHGIKLVPDIVAGGGADGGGAMNAFLGVLLHDTLVGKNGSRAPATTPVLPAGTPPENPALGIR